MPTFVHLIDLLLDTLELFPVRSDVNLELLIDGGFLSLTSSDLAQTDVQSIDFLAQTFEFSVVLLRDLALSVEAPRQTLDLALARLEFSQHFLVLPFSLQANQLYLLIFNLLSLNDSSQMLDLCDLDLHLGFDIVEVFVSLLLVVAAELVVLICFDTLLLSVAKGHILLFYVFFCDLLVLLQLFDQRILFHLDFL